jgi:hypothetical protein
MVGSAQERRLEGVLDGYSSGALKALVRAWTNDVRTANRMNKSECCVYLAQCLSDPGRVQAKIASLDEPSQILLAVAAQSQESLTVGRLVFAGQERGMREASKSVRRLMNAGFLLVERSMHENRLELSRLADRAQRVVVLPTKLTWLVALTDPPRESLPTVAEGRIRAIVQGEPARLVSALVNLATVASKSSIKITQAGHVAANQISRLQRASGLDEKCLPVPLALDLAAAADLLRPVDGVLRPTRATQRLLADPLPKTIKELLDALLRKSHWPDDLSWSSAEELFKLIREPPYDSPNREARRLARWAVAGLLGRLDTTAWVDIESFADLAIEISPALLYCPRQGGGYSGYSYGRENDFTGPSNAYEQAAQREYIRCCIGRTFLALGLVDVGQTGAKSHHLGRPRRDYSHWNRFCDPGGDRYRHRDTPKRPPWKPTPCGLAFRITDLGREVLRGEKAARQQTSAANLYVGPDFEVVAPRAEVPQEVLLRLDTFATPLDSHPSDPVRRYRLEKASLMRALRAGMDLQVLRADLETHSGRPLPDNVARTLDDWTSSFGTLELFLDRDMVELDSAAERDGLSAQDPKAVLVTKRSALVKRRRWPKDTLVVDYDEPPRACVTVKPDGTIRVHRATSDLLVESRIAQYADLGDRKWLYSLTREAVLRSGHKPRDILDHLRTYSRGDIPKGVVLAINGWLGSVAPLPTQTLTVIRIKEPLVVSGILARDELRDCILGQLSPSLLVVKKGSLKRLRKVLSELGISLSDGLDVVPLAA